jgi:tetratricopeptide (TPR) repeat protein
VVDRQGDLAWVGHPLSLEPVLRQMIDRTFDAKKSAEQQAELSRLEDGIQTAMNGRKWDRALELLNELEKAQPAGPLRDRVAIVRFHLLLQNGSYDEASTLGRELMERFKQDFTALNEMSWTILDEPGLGKRDLDLAEQMAIRAVELSQREDASILDTLARAQFEKGNLDEAIKLQTEAISKAPEGLKRMFQVPLERYQQAKGMGKGGSSAGDK